MTTTTTIRDYDHALTILNNTRTDNDIPVRQLAEETGCHMSTLFGNFKGKNRMSAPTLIAVAQALGYDITLTPRNDRTQFTPPTRAERKADQEWATATPPKYSEQPTTTTTSTPSTTTPNRGANHAKHTNPSTPTSPSNSPDKTATQATSSAQ